MTTYRVLGQDRECGAIGIMEGFTVTVEAETRDDAFAIVREQRYAANREHVLIFEHLTAR